MKLRSLCPSCTSLKSSSLRCCFLRSIIFTATCRPLCFSWAMQTTPVDPSPIFTKFSRVVLGSPGSTTICRAALNCSWVTFWGTPSGTSCWVEKGLGWAGWQAGDPVGERLDRMGLSWFRGVGVFVIMSQLEMGRSDRRGKALPVIRGLLVLLGGGSRRGEEGEVSWGRGGQRNCQITTARTTLLRLLINYCSLI